MRDGCWGPKQGTKPQRFEYNNITPSTSLQSCTVRVSNSAALGKKKGLIGLLGLDLGVGNYVWYRHYSSGCQSRHKMVVFKRQEPTFQGKPYDMKLSG